METFKNKSPEQNGCVELAHLVRNKVVGSHGILKEAMSRQTAAMKALIEAQKLLSESDREICCIVESLQPLINGVRTETAMINPTGGEIRNDPAGEGFFSAPRDGLHHKGLDLLCQPGAPVMAPMGGRVERDGLVYKGCRKYKLVVLVNESYEIKLMYCAPGENIIGNPVLSGMPIGKAQDITERKDYRKRGMLPHIHLEIRRNGIPVDPEGLIFGEDK